MARIDISVVQTCRVCPSRLRGGLEEVQIYLEVFLDTTLASATNDDDRPDLLIPRDSHAFLHSPRGSMTPSQRSSRDNPGARRGCMRAFLRLRPTNGPSCVNPPVDSVATFLES